ncbi:MAG: hypothetical protein ACNS63_05150 [Candidatus Nitrospinota bacterium M3_3B_026]
MLRFQPPGEAPPAVLILGWSCVLVAAFVLISNAGELMGGYRPVSVMLWGSGKLHDALMSRMPLHIENWLLFRTLSNILQIAAMSAAVFAALKFLQLKEWGRRFLEQVIWFELVFQASSRLYYLVNISSFVPAEAAAQAGGSGPVTTWMVAGLGSWVIFCALVLWYLSSGRVKDAMR